MLAGMPGCRDCDCESGCDYCSGSGSPSLCASDGGCDCSCVVTGAYGCAAD